MLPGPGGLPSPYALDGHEGVDDPGAWQLWWSFNKDPYLRFNRINTGAIDTLGGDFYLGKGEKLHRVGGRADAATVQELIVPQLLEAMKQGGSNEFMRGCLLAIAKIGGHRNLDRFNFTLNWFLDGDNGNQLMNLTAPVALGVLADPGAYRALAGLAKDDAIGREIYGRKVNQPMRAFAAYGLGLIGARTADKALRQRIVRDLVVCLESEEEDNTDLRVAAMTAIGLVPLEVVEDDMVCYCGECKVPNPDSSLGSQVTYLLRYFTADREFDAVVRAHTATTLGRLIEAQPMGMSARLKEVVADYLIGSLQSYTRQPDQVKQSAILALGLIGDADGDPADRFVRWALNRAAASGEPMERRFALISLGRVAARRGQGDDPYAGTGKVRGNLMRSVKSGKRSLRPWAALGLGVMGFHLKDEGAELDPAVDVLLRTRLRRQKDADEIGALSVAVGLRADRDSAAALLKRLDSIEDSTARSYASLGLGMTGERQAVDSLQSVLMSAGDEPLLASRSGLALGLLGDKSVVDALLETLDETENQQTRSSITQALGYIGDERSIGRLIDLMNDSNESKEIRARAVVALGFASDHSSLSWRARLASGVNYLAQSDMLTSSDGSGILDIE